MLVVDDSHTVRCFLQRTFETKGFQVDVATNGWQALTQMQSHMYDIVFLDLEMPVMNGYRCAQAIRQWERRATCPVRTLGASALYMTVAAPGRAQERESSAGTIYLCAHFSSPRPRAAAVQKGACTSPQPLSPTTL
jgi:CheY-like chemotaxis protein